MVISFEEDHKGMEDIKNKLEIDLRDKIERILAQFIGKRVVVIPVNRVRVILGNSDCVREVKKLEGILLYNVECVPSPHKYKIVTKRGKLPFSYREVQAIKFKKGRCPSLMVRFKQSDLRSLWIFP